MSVWLIDERAGTSATELDSFAKQDFGALCRGSQLHLDRRTKRGQRMAAERSDAGRQQDDQTAAGRRERVQHGMRSRCVRFAYVLPLK